MISLHSQEGNIRSPNRSLGQRERVNEVSSLKEDSSHKVENISVGTNRELDPKIVALSPVLLGEKRKRT